MATAQTIWWQELQEREGVWPIHGNELTFNSADRWCFRLDLPRVCSGLPWQLVRRGSRSKSGGVRRWLLLVCGSERGFGGARVDDCLAGDSQAFALTGWERCSLRRAGRRGCARSVWVLKKIKRKKMAPLPTRPAFPLSRSPLPRFLRFDSNQNPKLRHAALRLARSLLRPPPTPPFCTNEDDGERGEGGLCV